MPWLPRTHSEQCIPEQEINNHTSEQWRSANWGTSSIEAAPADSTRSSCSAVSSTPAGLRSCTAAGDGVPSDLQDAGSRVFNVLVGTLHERQSAAARHPRHCARQPLIQKSQLLCPEDTSGKAFGSTWVTGSAGAAWRATSGGTAAGPASQSGVVCRQGPCRHSCCCPDQHHTVLRCCCSLRLAASRAPPPTEPAAAPNQRPG